MNILFIANAYTPAISGVAISTRRFRDSLQKMGHRVVVIAPHYPDFVEQDPDVIRVRTLRNPFYPEYPLTLFRLNRALLMRLRTEKIDVVHVMQPFTIGRFARRVARALGVPLVFTHHARYDLYAHYVPLVPRALAARVVTNSVVRFGNRCDALVAPSRSTRDFMAEHDVTQPISVIPTGLAHPYRVASPKQALRAKLGLPADGLILLCVSRIAFGDKNIPLLLQMAERLRPELPNFLLVIIGGGPDLARLKRYVTHRGLTRWIRAEGPIQNINLAPYYSAADMFTYPSVTETQGIITLEALSAGLPVVATRAPGTIDFVTHEYNGLLTRNDPADFAAAVLRLARDTTLRAKLANRTIDSVAPYTAAAVAQNLLSLYQHLVSGHHPLVVQGLRS